MYDFAEIIAEYPGTTHICLGCGDPFDLTNENPYIYYCDGTIDCTWSRWYVVADGTIIDEDN